MLIRATLPAVIAMAVCALSGCDSKELTRPKAKQIIEKSEMYRLKKQSVSISPQEVNETMRHGYLFWATAFGTSQLRVTPAGRTFFDNADGQSLFGLVQGSFSVVPARPTKRKVMEITGITGQGDT